MKVKELKRILAFVDDDAKINFALEDDDEELTDLNPIEGRIQTKWWVPQQGELTSFTDDVDQTMLILLEVKEPPIEPANA